MRYVFHAPILGYARGAIVDETRLDHVEPYRLASYLAAGLMTEELSVGEDAAPFEETPPADIVAPWEAMIE